MKNPGIIFLGIADHIDVLGQPFPIGPIDMYRLSQHKVHLFFPVTIGPALTQQCQWVFAISQELMNWGSLENLKLSIKEENGKSFGEMKFISIVKEDEVIDKSRKCSETNVLSVMQGASSMILNFQIDSLIEHPGRFIVEANIKGKSIKVGEVFFHYKPTPPLTIDQIKAIKSDPNSAKSIMLELGCKFCSKKLKVYTSLERHSAFEESGAIWQYNIGKSFKCDCGKTEYSLQYIKESFHGLLLNRISPESNTYSFIRRYAYSQVVDVINQYNLLLSSERDEKLYQEFIEKHPMMLAMFHAKRLFIKPNIIGKFQTDFAILS